MSAYSYYHFIILVHLNVNKHLSTSFYKTCMFAFNYNFYDTITYNLLYIH